MDSGLIVKAISGFYYVQTEDRILQCRARGVFKNKGIHPLVGDVVSYTPVGSQEGVIESLAPRSSELVRPPVANMDHVLLTFSVREPDLSLLLLDRMLVEAQRAALVCTIALTKADLLSAADFQPEAELQLLLHPYRTMGYPVVFSSSVTEMGSDELRESLAGRKTVIAGQSGVGKSTLLNTLIPSLELKSGEISRKSGRGRHTTRQVELHRIADHTYVADTPGFSQLDVKGLKPEDLQHGFAEISLLATNCKYRGCFHEQEEGCAVNVQVGEAVSTTRYNNYLFLLQEVRTNYDRRY
ncbi:MAG: rsgA [Bacilli bacterium]|nr:rsgA [Bacilli bacterium]